MVRHAFDLTKSLNLLFDHHRRAVSSTRIAQDVMRWEAGVAHSQRHLHPHTSGRPLQDGEAASLGATLHLLDTFQHLGVEWVILLKTSELGGSLIG